LETGPVSVLDKNMGKYLIGPDRYTYSQSLSNLRQFNYHPNITLPPTNVRTETIPISKIWNNFSVFWYATPMVTFHFCVIHGFGVKSGKYDLLATNGMCLSKKGSAF